MKVTNVTVEKKSQPKYLLIVLVIAALVACITVDMVNPVLHLIGQDFRSSEAQVSWVVSGILLIIAIGVPIYGSISNFFSLKKIFSLALLVFAAGSLVCALAPNLLVLVLGRMLQGTGSAAIPVLSLVAVSQALPAGKRGGAIGIISGSIGIGTAIGPIFGGLIGQILGWSSLFWITFFLLLILVPCAVWVLPSNPPHVQADNDRRFDLFGGILLGLVVGFFLFGITQGQLKGFATFSSWGSLIGVVLSSVLFWWRITRVEYPFVPPSIFTNQFYMASVGVGFFTMFTYMSCLVFVPLLIVEVNRLSAGIAGLVLLLGAIAVAILSPVAGRLSDKVGPKTLVLIGVAIIVFSTLFLSTFAVGGTPVLVAIGIFGVGVGVAFTNPPANNAAANTLQKEQVGVGLGLFQASLFLGAGTGVSVIGAFLAARKSVFNEAINPLYALDAAPYSDVFLALTATATIALLFALRLQRTGADHN